MPSKMVYKSKQLTIGYLQSVHKRCILKPFNLPPP